MRGFACMLPGRVGARVHSSQGGSSVLSVDRFRSTEGQSLQAPAPAHTPDGRWCVPAWGLTLSGLSAETD
eukprot:3931265-Prymnesium_polylepis.1